MIFWKYAFVDNKWLWFHFFAGGIAAKILLSWIIPGLVVGYIATAAFLWELMELFTQDIDKVYGSHKRFFLDASGDILGAVLMAIVVVM